MFDALQDRLDGIFSKLRSRGRLTEQDIDEVAREIRLALLEADVNVRVVRAFIERIKEKAVGAELSKSLSPAQQFIKIVHDELVETLGGQTGKLTMSPKPPTVVMLAGLQGSGKTTAAGKLARLLKSQGLQPLLVGADLQRPAAVEQLRVLAGRVEVPVLFGSDRSGLGRAQRHRRSAAARAQRRDRRHRRSSADRRRADGRAAADPRRREAARHVARRRRDDRPRSGQRRGVVPRDRRPRRRDPHQDRRRRARWRGAVGEGSRRQADPVRRYRREARRLRAVPPRPDGEPHPRHGRHAHADREGRSRLRRRAAANGPSRSSGTAASRSRTSSSRCSRSRRWARCRTCSG